jgi:hypothetical protein
MCPHCRRKAASGQRGPARVPLAAPGFPPHRTNDQETSIAGRIGHRGCGSYRQDDACAWVLTSRRRPGESKRVARTNRTTPFARIVTALLMSGAAAIAILMAFQERATADFLATLGRTAGLERATDAAAYYAAAWFDVACGALLLMTAVAVRRVAGRAWFSFAVLVCCVAVGTGLWALVSVHPEVHAAVPADGLAAVLIALAASALPFALMGSAASPALAAVKPAIPMVPPSHQAG